MNSAVLLCLVVALQAPDPLPTTTSAPDTASAPSPVTVVPLLADPWTVATVNVPVPGTFGGTRPEVRVLRADGTAVSVAEGVLACGDATLVKRVARPPEDNPRSPVNTLQHGVVAGGAGALALVAAAVMVVGASATVAYHAGFTLEVPENLRVDERGWRSQGPALMALGAFMGAAGTALLAATAAHWGWDLLHTRAPADHATLLQPFQNVFAWDEPTARAVVTAHNRAPASAH